MKSVLIITVGTSDVQVTDELLASSEWQIHAEDKEKDIKRVVNRETGLTAFSVKNNRNKAGAYLVARPRTDGSLILENLDLYKYILTCPLVEPVTDSLVGDNKTPDLVMLVCTNQPVPPETEIRHYENDTCFFSRILGEKLRERMPHLVNKDILHYEIRERLTDIDFQYREFDRAAGSMIPLDGEELKQVILLAQGGIDQINQAVTLQLIRKYGTKLKLYQKSESDDPRELEFPRLFLEDLSREKLVKHLTDYDFGFVTKDLTGKNRVLLHLCRYAERRLSLRHDLLRENLNYLKGKLDDSLYERLAVDIEDDELKFRDLYCAAKINFLHGNLTDFIWRLFSLAENYFKVLLQKRTGDLEKFYKSSLGHGDPNPAWLAKISRIHPDLEAHLLKSAVRMNNPGRKAYFHILLFMLNNGSGYDELVPHKQLFKRLAEKMEDLARHRNQFAHNLTPIKKEQIEHLLGRGYGFSGLFQDFDTSLNISGYGIFDEIRSYLLAELNG